MQESDELSAERSGWDASPLQFQLWHLLALVVVVAVVLGLFVQLPRVEYPHPDLEHALAQGTFDGWLLKEKFGDTRGPFRRTTAYQFNAKGGKIVHYITDRQRQTRDLAAYQETVLAAFLTNPQGNDAVLIFVRETDSRSEVIVGK